MSTDRDTTRIVRSWLEDGATRLPDDVLGAVLAEVPTTPQRRATRWPAWRTPTMNKFLAIGLGAAAVVVALFVGAQLFGTPNGGTGGQPTPTPEPTVTAEPSPAEPSQTPEGLLPEGPLLWSDPALETTPFDGMPPITVTIPASGWIYLPESGQTGAPLVKGDEVNNLPEAAMLVMPTQADVYVYGDPCRLESTRPDSPATTVDEVVEAMAAQASRDASAPVDVTVDGFAGQSIILHVPDDADPADCEGGEFATFVVDGETGVGRYHQGPGQVDEFWILDVDGDIVIIDAMYRPDTPPALVEEMRAIAESATFEAP
jgi:hypothetical protein